VAFNLVFGGTVYWEVVAIVGALSAGFSTGSVALAKRGERELIGGPDARPALREGQGS
jgi:hypothetical protein